MNTTTNEVEVITELERAEVLLQPLRLRVMEAAREPASTAELARQLDLTPQKVNYHVRRLAAAGLLRKVEERRSRNVVERLYVTTARSYLLASDVLGGLSPAAAAFDGSTTSGWLRLQAEAEAELGETLREAASRGAAPAESISMDAELRFESAEQRAVFERALRELVTAIVGKYTLPDRTEDGEEGVGRPYRLILGCYPRPGWEEEVEPDPDEAAEEAEAEPDGG